MEKWSNEPRQMRFVGISTNGNGAATAGICFGSLSSCLGRKQSLVAMVSQWTNQGHWWRLSKMALMKLAKLTPALIVFFWWDCLTPTYVGGIDPWQIAAMIFGWIYLILHPGWWYTYPSEKYEFVSWDDDIPNIRKVIKFHGSKPPTSILTLINAMNLG